MHIRMFSTFLHFAVICVSGVYGVKFAPTLWFTSEQQTCASSLSRDLVLRKYYRKMKRLSKSLMTHTSGGDLVAKLVNLDLALGHMEEGSLWVHHHEDYREETEAYIENFDGAPLASSWLTLMERQSMERIATKEVQKELRDAGEEPLAADDFWVLMMKSELDGLWGLFSKLDRLIGERRSAVGSAGRSFLKGAVGLVSGTCDVVSSFLAPPPYDHDENHGNDSGFQSYDAMREMERIMALPRKLGVEDEKAETQVLQPLGTFLGDADEDESELPGCCKFSKKKPSSVRQDLKPPASFAQQHSEPSSASSSHTVFAPAVPPSSSPRDGHAIPGSSTDLALPLYYELYAPRIGMGVGMSFMTMSPSLRGTILKYQGGSGRTSPRPADSSDDEEPTYDRDLNLKDWVILRAEEAGAVGGQRNSRVGRPRPLLERFVHAAHRLVDHAWIRRGTLEKAEIRFVIPDDSPPSPPLTEMDIQHFTKAYLEPAKTYADRIGNMHASQHLEKALISMRRAVVLARYRQTLVSLTVEVIVNKDSDDAGSLSSLAEQLSELESELLQLSGLSLQTWSLLFESAIEKTFRFLEIPDGEVSSLLEIIRWNVKNVALMPRLTKCSRSRAEAFVVQQPLASRTETSKSDCYLARVEEGEMHQVAAEEFQYRLSRASSDTSMFISQASRRVEVDEDSRLGTSFCSVESAARSSESSELSGLLVYSKGSPPNLRVLCESSGEMLRKRGGSFGRLRRFKKPSRSTEALVQEEDEPSCVSCAASSASFSTSSSTSSTLLLDHADLPSKEEEGIGVSKSTLQSVLRLLRISTEAMEKSFTVFSSSKAWKGRRAKTAKEKQLVVERSGFACLLGAAFVDYIEKALTK